MPTIELSSSPFSATSSSANITLLARRCDSWRLYSAPPFFEARATEYSKAATRGDWNTVWSSFDSRRKAKTSDAANELVIEDEADMFKAAGIAAE